MLKLQVCVHKTMIRIGKNSRSEMKLKNWPGAFKADPFEAIVLSSVRMLDGNRIFSTRFHDLFENLDHYQNDLGRLNTKRAAMAISRQQQHITIKMTGYPN